MTLNRYPPPERTRSDVLGPLAALADVAETVPAAGERGCCARGWRMDPDGSVWDVSGYVGRVARNRWGKSYAVWLPGESGPHVFAGNSAFGSAEAAAEALVREVRRG